MQRAPDDDSTRIFASYSHKADSRWFQPDPQRPWMEEGLIPWLAAALREQGAKVWYDRGKLEYGDEFKQLICDEIERAHIAILIVSTGFLTSDFVKSVELPRIKDRAQRGELVVIPILAEPCYWDEIELLSSRLVLPGRPKTLVDYIDGEREWKNVRFQILDAIKKKITQLPTRAPRVCPTPEVPPPGPDTRPFPPPRLAVPPPKPEPKQPADNHRTRNPIMTGSLILAALVTAATIAFYVWRPWSQSVEADKQVSSTESPLPAATSSVQQANTKPLVNEAPVGQTDNPKSGLPEARDAIVFANGETALCRIIGFSSVYSANSAGEYDHGLLFAYHPSLRTVPRGTYVVDGDTKAPFTDLKSIGFVKTLDSNITEVSVNYKLGGPAVGYVLHDKAAFACLDPGSGRRTTVPVTRIKQVTFGVRE